MPIFDYRCTEGPGCEHCREGFEHLERLNAEPLAACPHCGAAVVKLIGAPALAIGGAHLQKEKTIGDAGFTQYRKIGKGVYEKTAGKGPKVISAD
ncbi:MAG: zinc ribbon domain-containing protein [Lysobacteraceae bacterium]